MAEQQRQRRLRHLRDGFNSNLIIACQNQKWHVDSAILINGSQYFEDILDQDFQVRARHVVIAIVSSQLMFTTIEGRGAPP